MKEKDDTHVKQASWAVGSYSLSPCLQQQQQPDVGHFTVTCLPLITIRTSQQAS